MKKIILLSIIFIAGCQRGDFKFSIVRKDTIAPHDGYFVNQSWYLYAGQTVPDDGYIIWAKDADPNELLE